MSRRAAKSGRSAPSTERRCASVPSVASPTCSSPRPRTRPWASTSTTPTPRRPRRTRTSGANCSSCTPSASAATPRTTSRTPPGSSPATASTPGTPGAFSYDPDYHATGPVTVLGLHRRQRLRRRPRTATRRLPRLPRPPPRTARAHRPQAGRPASSATPRRARSYAASRRSTSPTTPRSSRCCARAARHSRVHGVARKEGADPVRRRGGDLPCGRGAVAPLRAARQVRANEILWQSGRWAASPSLATARRAARQRRRWARPRASWPPSTSTTRCAGAWWPKGNADLPQPARGCRSPRSGADAVRPTRRPPRAHPSPGAGRPRSCCGSPARRPGAGPPSVITSTHRMVKWDLHRLLTVFLDSPTHMTRMTMATLRSLPACRGHLRTHVHRRGLLRLPADVGVGGAVLTTTAPFGTAFVETRTPRRGRRPSCWWSCRCAAPSTG